MFEDLFKRENLPVEVNLNYLKLFTCLLQKGMFLSLSLSFFSQYLFFNLIYLFTKDYFTEQQIEHYEKLLKSKLTDTGVHEAIKAYIGKVIEMIDKKN